MPSIYHLGWKNRLRDLYTQYIWLDELENLQPKLFAALSQNDRFFNDSWTYEIKIARQSQRKLVVRRPFWLGWQQRVDSESVNHGPKMDRKLDEFIEG